MTTFVVLGVLAIVLLLVVPAAVKIVQEYERGVIFRLGRLVDVRGPGFFLLIPFVETTRKVDLRIVTLEVPAQEAIDCRRLSISRRAPGE
jgi:regulator of protease activity HflC (stomatin/prohibitin superfamily)